MNWYEIKGLLGLALKAACIIVAASIAWVIACFVLLTLYALACGVTVG